MPFAPPPPLRIAVLALFLATGCTGAQLQDVADGGATGEEGGASGGSGSTGGVAGGQPVTAFEALTPASYVPKVKALLTGQTATAAEIASVVSDPTAMSALLDTWMATPEYADTMMSLFGKLFQQSNITQVQLSDQDQQRSGGGGVSDPNIVQAVAEMFPRTALALIQKNEPFTDLFTTTSFMMNVPLMVYYGVLEAIQRADDVTDDNLVIDTLLTDYPSLYVILKPTGGVIDFADTLNSASSNYMTFYDANPTVSSQASGCYTNGALKIAPTTANTGVSFTENLLHAVAGFDIFSFDVNSSYCAGVAPTPHWNASDFNWKMVTIRPPASGESTTKFWDVPTLRTTNTLVLKTPRVGYYTTPSFLGQWNTNVSNQARATINQTLIVGIGKAFDGSDLTPPVSTAALDPAHAAPGTACYNCHLTMDPMRQFFRSQYSLYFDLQTDPTETSLPGVFSWGGTSVQSSNIADLGQQLIQQAQFAPAWAKKVCEWATSSTCDVDDPELVTVAQAFKQSNYNWNTLVKTMLSSPLVTYATTTASAVKYGPVVSISRREELCRNLSSRLNITDLCGLQPSTVLNATTAAIAGIAQALPSEDYARGSPTMVMVPAPSMVYRTGVENICSLASTLAIDAGSTSSFTSTDPNAVDNLVVNFMGLPASTNAAVVSVLQSHYAAAVAKGSAKTDALRSTFVVACLSPYVAGIGY